MSEPYVVKETLHKYEIGIHATTKMASRGVTQYHYRFQPLNICICIRKWAWAEPEGVILVHELYHYVA